MALTAKPGMQIIEILGTEVEVPKSWTPERAISMFSTFVDSVETQKKRDKAALAAVKALKEKHPADYKTLLTAEYKKVGLTAKS